MAAPAYVPGFEWDIFISYARESNEPGGNDVEWVTEFQRLLNKEINERLPDKEHVKIYFDKRDFGTVDHIEQDLMEAARQSALFLPIVSPKYVAVGKYTLKELDAFVESDNIKGRIVRVDLLPVAAEEGCPQALQGLKRNNFYLTPDGHPIKLRPKDDEYARWLEIVASGIADVLKDMRKEKGAPVQDTKKPFSGKTVLLAEKEEAVDRDWESVRGWLRDFGVAIVPEDQKYPDDDVQFHDAIRADLEKADLFVQLLSFTDECRHRIDFPGTPSRAQLQFQAAVSCPRKVPLLQLRMPLEPQAQKTWDKFKNLLEDRPVVARGVQDFEREIKKKLEQAMMSPAPQIKTSASAKPYVYITADETDMTLAKELKEMAEIKLNLDVAIMADKHKRNNFKRGIKLCDAVVFLYGNGERKFIELWLGTYAKLRANGETKPPHVEALYWAPPPKRDNKQILREPMGSFLRLGSEDTFTLEGMQAILEELQRRRNGSSSAVVAVVQ